MHELQGARVAAGVARLPIDLLNEPHLQSRAFLQHLKRAFIGPHPQPSISIREGARPYPIRAAAPTLGQHNKEILSGLLELSDTEIEYLAKEGIIGTQMLSDAELAKSKKGSSDR
ncbi:CoA transferase [Bradyrhizobium ganzhouense]|uniref:CoA transferase n=1 Tax=Bradyrhizobium ganzhouense TaxID=1179767 RepID=UPI003CF62875